MVRIASTWRWGRGRRTRKDWAAGTNVSPLRERLIRSMTWTGRSERFPRVSCLTLPSCRKERRRVGVHAPGASVRARIPWQYGNTGGALGITDKFGNISTQPGLTGQALRETVRHDGVH